MPIRGAPPLLKHPQAGKEVLAIMGHKSVEDLEFEASVDELEGKARAATPARDKPPFKSYVLGFAILMALGLFNHWLFQTFFHTTHLQWYLKNGALIGFVTSLVATTWGDVNRNTDLISVHPLRYLRACLWLIGLPFYSLGTHLRRSDDPTQRRSPLDLLLALPFVLIIMGLLLIWTIVVVPVQYVVYLVCGAPARLFLQSEWRPVARLHRSRQMAVEEIPGASRIPAGWWDASLFSKPVSITGLMSSLTFFVLKPLLS